MKTTLTLLATALLAISAASHADDLRTPAIDGVVAANTPVQFIKDGFEGTEGPIGLPDGSLIFTETRANRITRIAADGSTSPFLNNSNGANGLAFDAQGNLLAVQTVKPQVGVIYPKGKEKVLATEYDGAPLARPNDLVVDKRSGIYFTDPGVNGKTEGPQPPKALYYLSPAGKLQRLANDIARPNGVQLSPDEKTLYIANTAGEHVLAYDVGADGAISNRRDFARLEGFNPNAENGPSSGADGLAVDARGRLYVASTAGVQVFSDKGKALGIIPLPKPPQNLAFAGTDRKTLYVVGRGAAYKIAALTPGVPGRAK
ncbi:MAG: gluconolactonase [Xanthomonadaceae bacterium]|nr:gluconolactonase [Xanthomonadaceae bacterium]